MTTARRNAGHAGFALIVLGAWAGAAASMLGVAAPGPGGATLAALPGVLLVAAGVGVLSARPRVATGAALVAIVGALWFAIAPVGGLFDAAPALGLADWVVYFFAPAALAAIFGSAALDGAPATRVPARCASPTRGAAAPARRVRPEHATEPRTRRSATARSAALKRSSRR